MTTHGGWRRAHPRAGGENRHDASGQATPQGSSPRGRGKPFIPSRGRRAMRLIPARAGKTSWTPQHSLDHGAHPRAGGENDTLSNGQWLLAGSSPRGRGKPGGLVRGPHARRLIPARAGKTVSPLIGIPPALAHPRAGGENPGTGPVPAQPDGSSPRGRGKRRGAPRMSSPLGLIPARAGKTRQARLGTGPDPAHPRAGGENARALGRGFPQVGSSPRGRGKHFLTCAFIKRIGQILETLELAVSSESYSLCDVYATDAPQDQARNTGLALPSSRAAS